MGLDNRAVTMRAAFDLAQIDIAIPEFSVPVLGKRPDHPKRGIPGEIVLPVDPLGLAGRTERFNRHPGNIGHVLRPAETKAQVDQADVANDVEPILEEPGLERYVQ